ncbi:MAG: hypothetical protein HC836_15740 [Richelia sp. RM2_1_2]|nr:hypothetical protein [Richelia sp. RM2_1_2]
MNDTDKHIEINDKVLIAGLYGDEFKFINNKIAVVKEIIVSSNHRSTHYIAKLIVDNLFIIPISFEFIYKITNPSINIDDFLISLDNPFLYYVKEKHIVQTSSSIMFDEYGQTVCLCVTRDNKTEIILIGSLN